MKGNGWDFGFSEDAIDARPAGLAPAQVKGYISQLQAKGLIWCHGLELNWHQITTEYSPEDLWAMAKGEAPKAADPMTVTWADRVASEATKATGVETVREVVAFVDAVADGADPKELEQGGKQTADRAETVATKGEGMTGDEKVKAIEDRLGIEFADELTRKQVAEALEQGRPVLCYSHHNAEYCGGPLAGDPLDQLDAIADQWAWDLWPRNSPEYPAFMVGPDGTVAEVLGGRRWLDRLPRLW